MVSSHTSQATWLYPVEKAATTTTAANNLDSDGDISMRSQQPPPSTHTNVNKYRPFRIVEEQVSTHLHNLMSQTTPETLQSTTSTMMAGALTLALSHINRRTLAWNEAHGGDIDTTNPNDPSSSSSSSHNTKGTAESTLQSRILILSVSSSTGSAHQYIPIMNAIFACQRLHIPIDVCKVSGDAVFLQQASDATKGVYMALDEPKGLLQYLMMAFLPDQRSRRHLVLPTRVDVDFRAACFCHRRVVDVGFVCSICLSIFCEPLGDGVCLTCGSRLDVSDYGAKPAVVARKKKKKKVKGNGMSAAGTPTPTPTPGP